MFFKTTNEYIGFIEIRILNDNIGDIAISVTPNKQNKHYGTEALKSIIKYGYEKIGLKGIDLNVYKTNLKAIHCYEKVGFVIDGEGYTEEDIHRTIKDNIKIIYFYLF